MRPMGLKLRFIRMSYGITYKSGKYILFGYSSIVDWFSSILFSFPAPWKLAPRKGKYYGTVIMDARDKKIISFWENEGGPSTREKEYFGDWSPEAWDEWCCDSHWESVRSIEIANQLIAIRNHGDEKVLDEDSIVKLFFRGRWEEEIWEELQSGGGPNKRALRK